MLNPDNRALTPWFLSSEKRRLAPVRQWILVVPLILVGHLSAMASVPVVAVFDIQNEAQLKPEEIRQLTNYLGAELTASRKYSVVPSTEIKRALQQKKAESFEACYDAVSYTHLTLPTILLV